MWFAVNTKPRKEVLAERSLNQKNVETYLPRVEISRRRGCRRYDLKEPLFPGYLFIHTGSRPTFETVQTINWTLGVKRMVSIGKTPLLVPEEVVNLIKWRIGEGDINVPKVEREFPPGSVVAVRHGAFYGLMGIVDRSIPSKERVRVFLDFMNRQTPVELDCVLLDRVS